MGWYQTITAACPHMVAKDHPLDSLNQVVSPNILASEKERRVQPAYPL
jgi:hypothetical protein